MDDIAVEKINQVLDRLLTNQFLDNLELPAEMSDIQDKIYKLREMHSELQRFSVALSKGELGIAPPSRKNYLAAGLKQLQMQLRHLTWQTQCISEGDYNQRVDFMGEFSEAFNKMVVQMKERQEHILAQRELMLRVFDRIEPVFVVDEADPMRVLYANKMANLRFHLEEDGKEKLEFLSATNRLTQDGQENQLQDPISGRWYRMNKEQMLWDQQANGLLYHCTDITAHVERESNLVQAANTDGLTGLNNRWAFERLFDDNWNMCLQLHKPLSVLMFDIDFFKKCNDQYGHLAGDKCLIAFAGILRENISRSNDVIARFGGEEFVVLLPFTPEAGAIVIAEKVRKATEDMGINVEKLGKEPSVIHITVSGGAICRIPDPNVIKEELLLKADEALYAAKQLGRNKICVAAEKD